MFFYLSKLLFSVILQFKDNFVRDKTIQDWALFDHQTSSGELAKCFTWSPKQHRGHGCFSKTNNWTLMLNRCPRTLPYCKEKELSREPIRRQSKDESSCSDNAVLLAIAKGNAYIYLSSKNWSSVEFSISAEQLISKENRMNASAFRDVCVSCRELEKHHEWPYITNCTSNNTINNFLNQILKRK